MEPPYRTWVEISRAQIAANFRAVRALVGPAVEVVPVVKADAYGHGAVEVARIVAREGARWLAVSTVEEGVALREAGIAARILVMADTLESSRAAFLEYALTPVVVSLDDLRAFEAWLAGRGAELRYHLKVDTGMGRLGVIGSAEEIARAVRAAQRLRLEGLMSHLASAADYASPQTDEQIRRFTELLTALRRVGIVPAYAHLASTIPVAYARREAWFGMVRTGHALYGYVSPARGPAPKPVLEVKPALTWKARILSVKQVPAGWPIGYGAMFRAPRPMRIGILGVGYADGLPHRLSNRGQVIAHGRFAPILGAVSMDLTTVDLSDCPEAAPGDAVTLIGEEGAARQDAQQLARLAGTISYDVLCGIRARVKRVYV
ncbi:MAG: alanine racemase [Bryobacteraceae bacterium]|nr:alanine racemase [Bryobacteraceae bacterium]